MARRICKTNAIFLWLIPIVTLLIIHYRYNRKSWRGVICSALLSIAMSIGLIYTNSSKQCARNSLQ